MFKINALQEKEDYGKFTIEPLEGGFGHTLGNSLRRVLLSNLEGSAITSIKIAGVRHQFSTIEGAKEDVIEIILNLKKVRVAVFSDKGIKLSLKVSGKKQIKASDIEVLGEGEVINLDQPIATLTSPAAKLNIEMVAEKGKGFSVAEERKAKELGEIVIDAAFSPVIDVKYSVDATRVGREANYDRLNLEVLTDGTLKPSDALNQAAKILSTHFKQIYEPEDFTEEEKQSVKTVSDEVLNLTVEELDLPVRITNALKAIDVEAVGQLTAVPRVQLMKAKNLGSKSLSLISEKLAERGLTLSET